MTTKIRPYKITVSEVVTIIPLLIGIILAHIAILIWISASQIYFLFNRIINWFKKNKPPS